MKFYLSNIRPAWPFERQEAILDAKAPGWRGEAVYIDKLSARRRKAHGASFLTERALALRPNSRADGGEFFVASLAVLDWSVRGLLGVLAALAANHMTLVSLECGTRVPPDDVAAAGSAVAEFERAIRRVGDAKKNGGLVSGGRRSLAVRARCEMIRERWGMEEWTTNALCAEARVSRPSAYKWLGDRDDAKRKYQISRAIAERNRKRRKNDE